MTSGVLRHAKVLVVDDRPSNLKLLDKIFTYAGCECVATTADPHEAVELFAAEQPDIVLLDLHMPRLSGYEVLEAMLGLVDRDDFVPVVVLTADATSDARARALSMGAHDFLTKPFDQEEVLLRARNLLRTRALHRQVLEHKRSLEERVEERTRDLEEARLETLDRLALAAEFRDDDTGQHTRRVGDMAEAIARRLGLDDAFVETIGRAAPLHDVGKIGIPDGILLKRGRLTPAEFQHVKRHTTIGARILGGSRSSVLQLAETIALTHHERWNGRGYPHGLAGEAIPIAGRIVAVADVYDALTHERPYKKAWLEADAIMEIEAQAGAQFDPCVVAAFSPPPAGPSPRSLRAAPRAFGARWPV